MIMAKITRSPPKTTKPAASKSSLTACGSVAANPRQTQSAKFVATKSAQAPAAKKSAKTERKISIKPWTPAEVREAFTRFRNANPEPKGELEHLNPYTLLVAVVLSAQATDAGVNKATRALESLPGAGRKTANVVLNMAFGERTMAVDTHVFRVGNRTGLAPGNTPLDVELGLERVIPAEFMLHAHHWLILHGRYTCLARKPRCEVCLINDLCRWPEKTVYLAPSS
jgi:endonuclease-3